MKCIQARAYIRLFAAGPKRREAMEHASRCLACEPDFQPDIVLERLLDASTPPEMTPSADAYQRLTMRINREVALQSSARRLSSSWEGVVLQLQNWVYAVSLAAVLVLGFVVYSGGFAPPTLAGRDRLSDAMISQRSDRLVLTRPDQLSQDEVLFALLSEDY